MFLNTLYTKNLDGDSFRDKWKARIEKSLKHFIRRYTSVPGEGRPADIASKSLMHSAILMCENMAYHYYCEPWFFNINMLYSVYHEMLSQATGVRRLILRHVVFVMQRWYSEWPINFTDSEWEAIASMRIALAMGAHPRLGTQSLLNALDPDLLPRIMLQWQLSSFMAHGIEDFDGFVARWNALYVTEGLGLLSLH